MGFPLLGLMLSLLLVGAEAARIWWGRCSGEGMLRLGKARPELLAEDAAKEAKVA
jgi:hypothetical protein